MTIEAADANAGRVSYMIEKFFGTVQSPFNPQIASVTASSLNPNKSTTRSNVIRSDGMRGPSIETAFDSSGELSGELQGGGTYDDLIEAVLRGIWSTDSVEVINFLGDVTFTNATSNVAATGAFANATAGDKFYVREATNAGVLTIATVTDDDNVVVSETISDETISDGSCSLLGYNPMAVDSTGALQVTASTRTLTLASAFTNCEEEQAIYISGMVNAENNGWHVIETVTDASNVVIYTPTAELTDETGPGTATVKGVGVRNGTVKRSFSKEIYMSDRDQAFLFEGQRVGTMALNLTAEEIATLNFGTQGTEVTAQSGEFGTTYTAAPVVDVMNATSNVAKLRMGNVTVPCKVQGLTVNVDDALRNQNSVGSKFPCGIGYGSQTVNGTITLYFQDTTYYTLFLNHTVTSLEFAMTDTDGNSIHFYFPAIRYTTNSAAQLPGIDQDVDEAMDWEAEPHDEGFQVQVTVYTV